MIAWTWVKTASEWTGGTAAAAAAVSTVSPGFLGITSPVLLACLAGALFGLAHTQPEKLGKLLEIPLGGRAKRASVLLLRTAGVAFTLAAVAVFCGWLVTLLPHAPGFAWLKEVPAVPVGGVLAYGGQRWIPRVLSAVDRLIERRGEA